MKDVECLNNWVATRQNQEIYASIQAIQPGWSEF